MSDEQEKIAIDTTLPFEKQVDAMLSGTYPKGEALLVREETPFILRQVGFKNLPILTTQKHLKDAFHPKAKENAHWHGLNLDTIKKLPNYLESPVMIMDSMTDIGSIVVVSDRLDDDKLPIIISVKADGNGMYNHIDIASNFLTGYYGKENFGNFLNNNLAKNTVLYWDKEKSQALLDSIRLQLPQALTSLDSDIIIRKSDVFVNKNSEKVLQAGNARLEVPREHTSKPLIINLFAGPSAGKTTAALELTAALKKEGYNVEYVSEFAKELVLEGRTEELKIQKFVTDEQYHRLNRLRNSSVEIIVTDSPVLLGKVYGAGNISAEYDNQILDYHNSFENFNLVVKRGDTFQNEGRVHNLEQSKELDAKILTLLRDNHIFYGNYYHDEIKKTVARINKTAARLFRKADTKNAENNLKRERNMGSMEYCIPVDTKSRQFKKLSKTIERINKHNDDGLGDMITMFAAVKAKKDFDVSPYIFGKTAEPIHIKAGQELVYVSGERYFANKIFADFNGIEFGSGMDEKLNGIVDSSNQFSADYAENEFFIFSNIRNNKELVKPFDTFKESDRNIETTKKNNNEKVTDNNSALSARDRVQQVRDGMVKTLLDYIEINPTDWQSGWNNAATGAPYNGKTNTAYRGINLLYLSVLGKANGYKDPRWVTFNQAKELGASVKKGEKSSPVIFFEYYDRATKKAFDRRTVKNMTDEEKAAYFKENVYTVLKYSSVFNAEQCHNFPERKEIAMAEEERLNQNAQIETIIANSSAPVLYDGGTRAYYVPYEDKIHLPVIKAFDTMQDYYATALHEIAHSTGHPSRLNRDMEGRKGSESYAREELRAELACVFMQIENGIQLNGKHITNHAAYLNSWLQSAKEDASVFYKAAADAQKIADYVAQNYMQAQNADTALNNQTVHSKELKKENIEKKDYMAEYLKTEQKKLEMEEQTLRRTRLEESIKEWYTRTYLNDDAGQDIHPDATFRDLQEELDRTKHGLNNSHHIYGMLGEDSVIRERAFARLTDITNTSYSDIYSAFLGETTAQKLANARAQARRLSVETGEPYVTVEWAEKSGGFPDINSYDVMSLSEADKKLRILDAQADKADGYYKTKLHIDFLFEGKPDSYENCRFDIGAEGGGLVHHIDQFLKYDTFLAAQERAEVAAVLEYFKQHMEVSEYLSNPAELAVLSEEQQKDVNEYVERARNILNTMAPFSEYEQKMPPTPEDIEDAIYGYSLEKPNLSLRDCIDEVHEMSAATVKSYAKDYRAYLDEGTEYMNELEAQREREEQIAREDFPRDFEDDFTEAMLDAVEDGTLLPESDKNHKEKITLEQARNAMLDAQEQRQYHYAVRIENVPYTDPDDGYEGEEPAQVIYMVSPNGLIEPLGIITIDDDAFYYLPNTDYISYEPVEYEELEEIAQKVREPIQTYKDVLRAEIETGTERRRSDAYYDQRVDDILEEHYRTEYGLFERDIEKPRYLSGMLYAEETFRGERVVSLTQDENGKNIAIIAQFNGQYAVAEDYHTDDGRRWGKAHYFNDQKSAEEFRVKNFPSAFESGDKEKPKTVSLSEEQLAGILHGAEIADNLKTYDKWRNAQSPMLKEYLQIKHENPPYTVFYRLGDFYEVFGADAERAANILDLTLIDRDIGMPERIPMSGVPFHRMDEYAAKLAEAGESIVIADGKDIRRIDAVQQQSETTVSAAPGSERYVFDFKIDYGNEFLISSELKKLGLTRDFSVETENFKRDEQCFNAGLPYWMNDIRYVGENGKELNGTFGKINKGILIENADITRFTAQSLSQAEIEELTTVLRGFDEHMTLKLEKVHEEPNVAKEQDVADNKQEKTIADELSGKSVWLKINLPEGSVGGQYGNNTLVRMPNGEYSHFGVFVPSKFIKNDNGKTQLTVGSKFSYRLSNDGREVTLTGQELTDCFAGKAIGKAIERVAPSRRYAKVLENLEKNVPTELKEIPTWCCYRTKWNEDKGKKDKFIISPIDGKWTSSKEPGKWVPFDKALKYARENNCEGLSLLLDKQHGITCIDLDKCITDANTGAMKERATKLVTELKDTYIERSTSGNGVHIFLKDDILKNGQYRNASMVEDSDPRGDIEVFDDKRIISMTGDMISANNNLTRAGSAATVYLRQELGEHYKRASGTAKPQTTGSANLSDNELIRWIRGSKQGGKFDDLYSGRSVSGDRSNDDGKLAHMLLYFNGGDKDQAFRIMRESGRNRADKPDSYYRHTIDKMDERINEYAKRPSQGNSKHSNNAAAGPKKNGAQA